MIKIAVVQSKGGSSRSTTCFNLSTALQRQTNGRLLMVDLDEQGSLSSSFLATIPTDNTVLNIFEGKPVTPTPTYSSMIDILPATRELGTITAKANADFEIMYRLADFLDGQTTYDMVIIDTPPSIGHFTMSALVAAEWVLVPVSTQIYSVQVLDDVLDVMMKVKKRINSKLRLLGVIPSITDRTVVSRQIQNELTSKFNGHTLPSISRTVKIEESHIHRKTVLDHFPSSVVAIEYITLASAILERIKKDTEGKANG
ncbi:MAG: ParA family protein [Spirochaetes bacterium]|nr:ParA family protein [Spirochaetota bacterium]